MTRTFKVTPFELSPERKAELIDQARTERLARREREEDRHWEAGTGPASDGRVLDAIGNWGNRQALGDDGMLDRAARRYFEDPDANIGGLVAGAGEQIRILRGREAPELPAESIPDSPPLELRMPR